MGEVLLTLKTTNMKILNEEFYCKIKHEEVWFGLMFKHFFFGFLSLLAIKAPGLKLVAYSLHSGTSNL
jgi:hypothetical protein